LAKSARDTNSTNQKHKPKAVDQMRFPALKGNDVSLQRVLIGSLWFQRLFPVRRQVTPELHMGSKGSTRPERPEHSIPASMHTSEAVRMLTPENVSFSVKENGFSLEFLTSYPSPSFAVFWNKSKRARTKCSMT